MSPRRKRAPIDPDDNARDTQRPEHGRDELPVPCEPGWIATPAGLIAERGEPIPIRMNDPKTIPCIVAQIAWIKTDPRDLAPLNFSA
jgi:hypothetical protein